MPLHPLLVHMPLGLALLLPALAIAVTWALWTGRLQPRAWLSIVLLQALLVGAGLLALNTGQHEGDRVEAFVPKMALETHEEYAEQFLWIAGITLAVSAVVLAVPRSAVRPLTSVAILGTLMVAGAALRVGHAGGRLVYVHNAGAAYVTGNKANAHLQNGTDFTPPPKSRDDD